MSNGRPIPDPDCTPGAFNPTLTLTVLKTKGFTTKCVRDQPTSKKQKEQAYSLYGIERPDQNYGLSQTCELDHLISMNLGGAETLDNIWPLCGPADVSLDNRYFKQKGLVENYLAREVRAGRISLADAQKGIAEDWTRYITSAINACQSGGCK
jgi:hypothetical protein